MSIALAPGCGEPAEPDPIEIGVVLPLADTSPMQEARQSWELVLDEINAAGGVHGGRRLEVDLRSVELNDPADLAPITEAFLELTQQGYKYIISLLGEAELAPTMDAATSSNVLAMSIIAEDSAANLARYDGMLLRAILPTDRLINEQAVRLQADGRISLAAVGETRQQVPDARLTAMLAGYASCDGCRTSSITYPAEADLFAYDWSDLGARVFAAAPDVVFLAMANPSALVDAVRAIEVAGYRGPYYFAYGAYMGAVAPAFPGAGVAERFRSYDLALPSSDQLDRFMTKYAERHGETPVPEPRLLAFADYVALLGLSMSRAGPDDPHGVARELRELSGPPGEAFGPLDYAAAMAAVRAGRDIDYAGVSGSFDFDAKGDVGDGFIQEYGVDAAGNVYAR